MGSWEVLALPACRSGGIEERECLYPYGICFHAIRFVGQNCRKTDPSCWAFICYGPTMGPLTPPMGSWFGGRES